MKRVVILGGGISGLTAGYYISKYFPVTIVEERPIVGGRASVELFDNHLLDSGAQFILSNSSTLKQLCADLKILQNFNHMPIGNFHLYRNKKIHQLDFFGAFNYLSFNDKIQIAKLIFTMLKYKDKLNFTNVKTVEELDSTFFSSWFLKNFDKSLFEYFAQPLVSSLSMSNPEEISAAYGLSLLFSSMFGNFYGMKGGVGKISNLLAKHIETNGGKIYLSEKVLKIKTVEKDVINVTTNKRRIKADIVISSLPIPEFSKLSYLSPPIKKTLNKIRYTKCIYASIGLKSQIFDKKFALLMPRLEWKDHLAILESTFKSSVHVPQGFGMVELFVYANHAEKLFNKSENIIKKKLIKDLQKIFGFSFDMHIKWIKIRKIKYSLPIHTKDYYSLVSFFYENNFRNLYFCGDYMAMPSLETAVWSGKRAANKILSSFL